MGYLGTGDWGGESGPWTKITQDYWTRHCPQPPRGDLSENPMTKTRIDTLLTIGKCGWWFFKKKRKEKKRKEECVGMENQIGS